MALLSREGPLSPPPSTQGQTWWEMEKNGASPIVNHPSENEEKEKRRKVVRTLSTFFPYLLFSPSLHGHFCCSFFVSHNLIFTCRHFQFTPSFLPFPQRAPPPLSYLRTTLRRWTRESLEMKNHHQFFSGRNRASSLPQRRGV